MVAPSFGAFEHTYNGATGGHVVKQCVRDLGSVPILSKLIQYLYSCVIL